MMESSKDELRQSPNNFFHFSNKEGFKCSSQKMARSNKPEPYRTPRPALALAYSPTFDHTAAFPKSPHWKPVKCYIHFKELLLFSKVLNTKLESLSNLLFALCSRHKCEITVSGFIGSPASLRDCSSTAFCWCASLSGSIICFRV